jgi:hypothetical protein
MAKKGESEHTCNFIMASAVVGADFDMMCQCVKVPAYRTVIWEKPTPAASETRSQIWELLYRAQEKDFSLVLEVAGEVAESTATKQRWEGKR